jgi:hypothetical protein
MATTLGALPRELAHWTSLTASTSSHSSHPHPLPMTPPHSDRLAQQQHSMSATSWSASAYQQQIPHSHSQLCASLSMSLCFNSRVPVTPPDDTPPRDSSPPRPSMHSYNTYSYAPPAAYAPPPTYKPDPPGWPAPLRAASSSALAPASTSATEDAAKAPAQDEDEPPLAWAASWLHPTSRPAPESAALVAEKTCEMICYLWFAGAGGAAASSSNNTTSGKEEGGRATPSALQLTASPTFVSFTQKLLETTQVSSCLP